MPRILKLPARRPGRVALVCLLLTANTAMALDDNITFTWVSKPTQTWPAEVKAIAVVPPIFDNSGQTGGIVRNEAEGWYTTLLGSIKTVFARAMPGVRVLERIDLGTSDVEKLRGETGVTRGASQAQFAGAQANIVSRLGYTAEVKQISVPRSWWERAVERGADMIPYIPGSRYKGDVELKTLMEVSVMCELKVVLVSTGVTVASYSNTLVWKQFTDRGFLGFGAKRIDELPSGPQVVKELITQHVDEFCSQFVPVQRKITANLGSVSDELEDAISEFNLGRVEQAAVRTRNRLATHHDDHRACFVMGICAESQNKFDFAREWYRKAASEKNENLDYRWAMERVANRVEVGDAPSVVPAALPQTPVESRALEHEGTSQVRVKD